MGSVANHEAALLPAAFGTSWEVSERGPIVFGPR
jgi:hypothetical protein